MLNVFNPVDERTEFDTMVVYNSPTKRMWRLTKIVLAPDLFLLYNLLL